MVPWCSSAEQANFGWGGLQAWANFSDLTDMPLFLVTRSRGADHLRNPSGIHAALVVRGQRPRGNCRRQSPHAAAEHPVRRLRHHAGAATAAGASPPCVFQGDALGTTYTGPGLGA
jgi:hypothetical protein